MKTVVALLGLAALAHGDEQIWGQEFEDYSSLNHKAIFQEWKKDFGKTYVSLVDEAAHYLTFLDNLYLITETNAEHLSYRLRLNQFADLNSEQFKLMIHGHTGSCYKRDPSRRVINANTAGDVGANPTSIDWRNNNGKNYVTPVKNQGQCGSCWAFSTTGSLECDSAIAGKPLTSLSEQQLVDCSHAYGNLGCDGGTMDAAFKYVKANGGLCSETAYPYKGVGGTCKSSTCGTFYDPITGYTDVTTDSEASLTTAVASGCVSVAIEADQTAFQFYSSGILSGTCGTSLDHGVLLVGYGSQSGSEYWWLKNSWGTSWGEKGYCQLCRNCNKNGAKGECGVNEEPSFPLPTA
jgi:C1A family cysteine protease